MSMKKLVIGALALFVVGCVTINIYFPEAAAQEAADRIIDEVRGAGAAAELESSAFWLEDMSRLVAVGVGRLRDVVIPAAHAQANFDASSPASHALEASLKARFSKVKPFLDSGAVGLTADGLLDVRDLNAVPLKERNSLRQLVTAQNTDWAALYKEIARINDHPEWVAQIRQVFATRWVAKANKGWYYRDGGGSWVQK